MKYHISLVFLAGVFGQRGNSSRSLDEGFELEFTGFDNLGAGFQRSGGGVVSPVGNLIAQRDGTDFVFRWDLDATHVSFGVSYTETIGNYEAAADPTAVVELTVIVDPDDANRKKAVFAQPSAGAQFRFEVFAYDAAALGGDSSVSTIVDAQSTTAAVTHLPGTPYEGGSGYSATVLLPTDFSAATFFKADLSDTLGYTAAIKVAFPAGCETIHVSADMDGKYIYKDDNIATKHLIFVFPSTHFSNQFKEIRYFHYYVSGSNYVGCDLSDPSATVTLTDVSATYLERVTNEAATLEVLNMWPSDSLYPPVEYSEQHQIDLSDIIQPQTHLGPNIALSAPRVTFATAGGCNAIMNVEDGQNLGWGYLTTYNSGISMTDLWSDSPTSNTGQSFKLSALDWLTKIGVSYRYMSDVDGCEVITTSATRSYVKLNSGETISVYVNV